MTEDHWMPGEKEAIAWIKASLSLAQLELRVAKLQAEKPKVWHFMSVQAAAEYHRGMLMAQAEIAGPV